MPSLELLIRGGTVVTLDAERRVGRFDLRVVGGAIVEIGPSLERRGPSRIIDATGLVVIPGLVHSHLHLCQALLRNSAEDRELLPWLRERVWPLEAAHDADTLRASADLGIAELLRSGATCALDMGTVRHHDVVFESARDAGIRLVSGKAMMDVGDDVPDRLRETTRESLDESDRLRAKWDGAANGRLGYAYAPRFVLSCCDELLGEVARRVEQGARLHTHASENPDEVAVVRRLTGRGNVEHLHDLGLLSPRTTLAHCVHLDDHEPELMAKSGTSVAHCPSANLKLASGIADVPMLLAAGVTVGIGADGAPCNNNLDVWREMKLAGLLPRLKHGPAALEARKIFELATLGGARALGLESQIGSIEVGKRADLALVDLNRPHAQPAGDDVYTQLVYAAQASDVEMVLVDGEVVVRGGRVLTLDENEVVRRSQSAIRIVRERAGLPVGGARDSAP